MEPVRETYGMMPPGTDIMMYLVLAPFAALFVYGVFYRVRRLGVVNTGEVFKGLFAGVGYLVKFGLLQRKVVSERLAGLMHLLIYSGIIALFIGTTLVFLDHDILRFFEIRILRGDFYLFYEASLDFMGLALLAGLGILLYRRMVAHESRLRPRSEYVMVLAGLLFIGVSGYVLEGVRLAVEPRPWGGWSFVGKALSSFFSAAASEEALIAVYRGFWWSHAVVAFAMVALIPYSSLGHMFSTLLHIALNAPKQDPLGKMHTPFKLDELDPSGEIKLGFKSMKELSWMQRLGLEACTDCGRCEAACPAFAAGTPLSPRNVVQKLKGLIWSEGGLETDVFASGVIDEEEVWACTTCNACIEACPVLIRPMDYILEMRRSLTLEGRLDKRKTAMLTNLARYGNPYGLDSSEKETLLAELASIGVKTVQENPDAEYVYWIGCASFYDARSREIVKSMAKILLKAQVSFAVLGMEESCTGDPARRIGEEGRFQEMALSNLELLKKVKARKVIVHCPHCFNTFRNEYPDFGLKLEVTHHTQVIGELLKTNRLKLVKPLALKLTLHDSCYIGRVNGVFEEPRQILRQAAGGENFVELSRRGLKSFCCGAGGSTYWYEVRRSDRESLIRLREALNTGASVLAVECPYCMQMFGDAVRVMGAEERIRLKDIAEIVAESI
ncbi:MAG: (Fe-S)-binding protein [Candidatus Caldarchaeum sp.]|nr:(Fe-S)-binding protein [Candidatus Caldarchaeum sp.]